MKNRFRASTPENKWEGKWAMWPYCLVSQRLIEHDSQPPMIWTRVLWVGNLLVGKLWSSCLVFSQHLKPWEGFCQVHNQSGLAGEFLMAALVINKHRTTCAWRLLNPLYFFGLASLPSTAGLIHRHTWSFMWNLPRTCSCLSALVCQSVPCLMGGTCGSWKLRKERLEEPFLREEHQEAWLGTQRQQVFPLDRGPPLHPSKMVWGVDGTYPPKCPRIYKWGHLRVILLLTED